MSVGSAVCRHCGWLNASGESHCYHCNQRLDAGRLVAGLEDLLAPARLAVLFAVSGYVGFWLSDTWYLLRLGGSLLTAGASGTIFGLMGAEIGLMRAGVGDHHTRSATRDSAGSPGNLGWRAAWWVYCQSAVSTLRSAAKISRPERT